MSRRRPLSLSDQQLQLVMTYAPPPCWRDRYLTGVADLLQPLDYIDDNAVLAAIEQVRTRIMGIGDNDAA
jgi:hypothetical protein